jgi:hypothetical protein
VGGSAVHVSILIHKSDIYWFTYILYRRSLVLVY